jgi:predicted acetyltransferase
MFSLHSIARSILDEAGPNFRRTMRTRTRKKGTREKRPAAAAPATEPAPRFRRARPADLDRLLEIHLAAYPDDRSVLARQRAFVQHPFGGLAHVVVAEQRGAVAAQALLLPLRSAFGGRGVAVGGIASLAVAPERRGCGLATALMDHLHALSDARGDVLTLLYAFRQGFYARLGYATTASRKRLSIDTRSVPRGWRELGRSVRPAVGKDRIAIQRAYLRGVGRSSGWLVRPARYWEQLFARDRVVLFVLPAPAGAEGLAGYVAFALEKAHAHAETTAVVEELVAEDGAARRALLGALASLRDQVSEIHLEVAEGDPLERALVDPDGRRWGSDAVEHGLGEVVGGPMIRIEDVPRALEARGYEASGAFDVVVRERAGGEHVLAAGVRVAGGTAEVGPARGGGALTTTRAGLAAIFYGGLELADAVGLGLATVDPRVAARVAAIAKVAPMGPMDAF